MPPSPINDRTQSKPREGALAPYLRAIQAHRLIFVVVVVATVAAAAAWTVSSGKEYEATAEVLVTPVSQDNQELLPFELVRETGGDPTRTVQTAAALLETRAAANKTARALGEGQTADQVLNSMSIQPAGESNVLDVTATADTPAAAANLANTFTNSSLALRRERLEEQITAEIERLEDSSTGGTQTKQRIASLEAVQSQGDPTLSLAQRAVAERSPIGASAALVIGLALIAGLALGTGAAVVLELIARRIRDEDEALALYPLPVLARVPELSRQIRRQQAAGTWPMPPNVREPFRTVLTQIHREGAQRTIMFTSGSTGDGKTTSSINLAMTIALGGHATILFDTDLRKPGVSEALGLVPRPMEVPASGQGSPVANSLVRVPGVEKLSLLSPMSNERHGEVEIERFFDAFPDLLEEAGELADYVVVDTPPLGEISDALRITSLVDEIILVVYPGKTNRANFEIMRELLDRSGDRPTGLLVIGDRTGAATTYYGYAMEKRHLPLPKDHRLS